MKKDKDKEIDYVLQDYEDGEREFRYKFSKRCREDKQTENFMLGCIIVVAIVAILCALI